MSGRPHRLTLVRSTGDRTAIPRPSTSLPPHDNGRKGLFPFMLQGCARPGEKLRGGALLDLPELLRGLNIFRPGAA